MSQEQIEKMLERRVKAGLERSKEIGRRMAVLRERFLTGVLVPTSEQSLEWPVLHQRIARLNAGNEAMQKMANEIAKLVVNVSQRVTKLEEHNGNQ